MTSDVLAQMYGTADAASNRAAVTSIAKHAGLGTTLAVGAGAAGFSMLLSKVIQRQREEAELVNRAAEELEARRMYPTTRSMSHTRVPPIIPQGMEGYFQPGMDEGMVRMAAAIGGDMAHMEKDAFGGLGGLAKGFGALASGAAKNVLQTGVGAIRSVPGQVRQAVNTSKAISTASRAANFKPGVVEGIGRRIEMAGAKMKDKGDFLAGRTATQGMDAQLRAGNAFAAKDRSSIGALRQKATQSAQNAGAGRNEGLFSSTPNSLQAAVAKERAGVSAQQAAVSTSNTPKGTVKPPRPAIKAPAVSQPTAPVTTTQAAINPSNALTPTAQTPAAAAGQVSKPGALQRTGLFDAQGNFRTGRAVAAAGLIGAGYLGLKGLKKGVDYMSEEPKPANYNLGGNQLQMGVNQYGNPQF